MEESSLLLYLRKSGQNVKVDMGGEIILQGAIVRLHNVTDGPLDLHFRGGPEQALTALVCNADGEVVSAGYRFGSFRSLVDEKSIAIPVGSSVDIRILHLLETLPREKQQPGKYRVRVRLDYKGRAWESNEVWVQVE